MRKKSFLQIIVLAAIIIIHILICAIIGYNRQYMFTDEVYSYGLANSENYSFLDPGSNTTLLNWTGPDFFKNYLQYNDGFPFSFRAAFVNQANDVHPPLYYCLLHIICFFLQGLGYSTVPGITLNLILIPFIDILLYFIAKYFIKSEFGGFATLILWAFSSAGLSNVIFIRMYLLVTLEILGLIAFHIYFYQHIDFQHVKFSFNYILLSVIVAAGGLTHYYFYFFAASLGLCMCVYFLVSKKIKLLLLYGGGLCIGPALAFLIFPSALKHIFSYRGNYATSNLGEIDFSKIKIYCSFINSSLFGNLLWIIIIFFFVAILFRLLIKPAINKIVWDNQIIQIDFDFTKKRIQKTFKVTIKKDQVLFFMLIVSTLFYIYISIQGSEIVAQRYIYPAYPILSLVTVKFLYFIWGNTNKTKSFAFCLVLSLLLSVFSVKVNGIDWRYADYPEHASQVSSMQGKDCIIICRDGKWVNVLQGINLYKAMNEVCCVYESNLDRVAQLLDERNTKDSVYIAFYSDAGYSNEEMEKILNSILDSTGMTQFQLVYDYYTKVYCIS